METYLDVWILFSIHGFLMNYCVQSEEVEIITTFGRIKGLITRVYGDRSIVYQFRKIPFALPPVGDLRFEKPVTHRPLSGLYDATEYGPSCMQSIPEGNKPILSNLNVSEDCLHLNIFVPHSIGSTPKAVMVWIHGGGFTIGQASSTYHDGSFLATTGNVIVVTINYRLGLFGFLSTEDSHYPGNYGLFDQMEAIKWVKHNIGSFGGDPNKITVFGESAGAFSVAFLAISPLSKGLFQRAIMESGGDLHSYVVRRKSRATSIQAMQLLGCFNGISINADTKKCLTNADPFHVLNISDFLMEHINEIIPWYRGAVGPTVDGELLPDIPEILIKNSSSESMMVFKSLDIMAGMNSADGGSLLYKLWSLEKSMNFTVRNGISTEFFCHTLVPSLVTQYFDSNEIVAKRMCGQYTALGNPADQARSAINWFGDFVFGSPMKQILDLHVQYSAENTYQYLFSKTPSQIWLPLPPWFRGANHADEVQFVFGLPVGYSNFTQSEEMLSKTIMLYWTNFAKTGNPNVGGIEATWAPYSSRRAYINLDDHVSVRHDLYIDRFVFWLNTVPSILSKPDNVEVTTTFGRVKGVKELYEGNKVIYKFRKIPYALPPVGKLRFQRPLPHGPLKDLYDATHFGPSCLQEMSYFKNSLLYNTNISEDCLHLNIYVPNGIHTLLKAVMVWIHGGAYSGGNGQTFDGSHLAMAGDVIVVTINYRLGLVGFLSTGDDRLPGNYGLWDQLEALRWVKQHIKSFGGDPNRITIFGESAGAYSVGLLSILPRSRNLFERVICESGVALSPHAFSGIKRMKNITLSALRYLGCLNDSVVTSGDIQCLQTVDEKLSLNASKWINSGMQSLDFQLPFTPVVDGDLIPDEPSLLLRNKSSASYQVFSSTDLLVGLNSGEGSLVGKYLVALQKRFNYTVAKGVPTETLCHALAPSLADQFYNSNKQVAMTICNAYTNLESQISQARKIADFYSDWLFGAASKTTLDLHSKTQRGTYQYFFSMEHRPYLPYGLPWFQGVRHGGEVPFVFGPQLHLRPRFTKEEQQLSNMVMRYWTNFAKTGNPNSGGTGDPVWLPYDSNEAYIELSSSPSLLHSLNRDRLKLWEATIPAILQAVSSGNPVNPIG